MKTIKVGQILLVAVLSQSMIACLSGGGGGSSAGKVDNTVPTVELPTIDGESDSGSGSGGNSSQPANPNSAKVTGQDQQSLRQNSGDGQITLRGENLDLVTSVRLVSIDGSSSVIPTITAQGPGYIDIDALAAAVTTNTAYRVSITTAAGGEVATGKVLLNSEEMAQVDVMKNTKTGNPENMGCMVMKDSSLRCYGRADIVQFQGDVAIPKVLYSSTGNSSLAWTNFYISLAGGTTYGLCFNDETLVYELCPNMNFHQTWVDFIDIKGSTSAKSFNIRDVNNNPVISVAEVAVAVNHVCYRKLDNTVYCLGSNNSANPYSFAAQFQKSLAQGTALTADMIKYALMPIQVKDTDGSALKLSSLKYFDQSVLMGTRENGALVQFSYVSGLLTPKDVKFNGAAIVPVSMNSPYAFPISASEFMHLSGSTATKLKVGLLGNGFISGYIDFAEIHTSLYTGSNYLVLSTDRMTIYSCTKASSEIGCSTTPYYAAGNAQEKVSSIKTTAYNVCIRDVSERIRCVGSKVFGGTDTAAINTSATYMNYVGKDLNAGKLAALVGPVWHVGIAAEIEGSNKTIKHWGSFGGGTNPMAKSFVAVSGQNFSYYANAVNTQSSSAGFQALVDGNNAAETQVKILYSTLPTPVTPSYDIPSL